ncbi:hypothetical protein L579_4122 [Pantoea sp. AS-PWVM4]|nr:hypothetical protein L579_4122 [Pantoea sp. AS-PWVM4]
MDNEEKASLHWHAFVFCLAASSSKTICWFNDGMTYPLWPYNIESTSHQTQQQHH